MINYIIRLFFCIIITSSLFTQSIPQKFIDALINNKEEIKNYVDSDELSSSQRLGINYTGVKNKFLIGFDINDENIKNPNYVFTESILEDAYSKGKKVYQLSIIMSH